MDWSYDLLTDDERRVLEGLSVFAGGCSLDDAEAVIGGNADEELDVLEHLSALVRRSLVLADEQDGHTRVSAPRDRPPVRPRAPRGIRGSESNPTSSRRAVRVGSPNRPAPACAAPINLRGSRATHARDRQPARCAGLGDRSPRARPRPHCRGPLVRHRYQHRLRRAPVGERARGRPRHRHSTARPLATRRGREARRSGGSPRPRDRAGGTTIKGRRRTRSAAQALEVRVTDDYRHLLRNPYRRRRLRTPLDRTRTRRRRPLRNGLGAHEPRGGTLRHRH